MQISRKEHCFSCEWRVYRLLALSSGGIWRWRWRRGIHANQRSNFFLPKFLLKFSFLVFLYNILDKMEISSLIPAFFRQKKKNLRILQKPCIGLKIRLKCGFNQAKTLQLERLFYQWYCLNIFIHYLFCSHNYNIHGPAWLNHQLGPCWTQLSTQAVRPSKTLCMLHMTLGWNLK